MEDFPGGPVKTRSFHCQGNGFNLWLGKFHMLRGVAKKNPMEIGWRTILMEERMSRN